MTPERRTLLREAIAITERRNWSRGGPHDATSTAEILAELAEELLEASDRETPEDTSHDAGPNLEALAGSDAVEAVINLRLARERERNAEDLRRLVAWVIVGSLTLGFGLGLGLAALFLL